MTRKDNNSTESSPLFHLQQWSDQERCFSWKEYKGKDLNDQGLNNSINLKFFQRYQICGDFTIHIKLLFFLWFLERNRIFWGELFTRRKGHAKHFKSKYKNWHQRYLMYSFVFRIIALRRGKANECKGLSSKLTILMVSLDIWCQINFSELTLQFLS